MTLKRLGALLVAVVLVAGAFVVRNARAGDDDDATSSTATGDTTADPTDDPVARAVVCIPELRGVCDAIAAADPAREVRTEEAAITLDRLAAPADRDELPLWVTVRPFPGMVDAQRAAAGESPLALVETAIASTPLAVAALDQDRLDALITTCGDVDVWACLGEYAGRPWTELGGEASWGQVRPAVGDVTRSAPALVSFSAAAAGYLGTTSFNRSAWEANTGFLSWLRPLARTVSSTDLSGGTPLATMATRASAVNVAATTDAEIAALGAGAARFAAEYPASGMSLDAVIAAPDAVGDDALAATAARALTDAGWAEPSAPVGPTASTSLALLELWEATT